MWTDAILDKLGPCTAEPTLEPVGDDFNVGIVLSLVIRDGDPVRVLDVRGHGAAGHGALVTEAAFVAALVPLTHAAGRVLGGAVKLVEISQSNRFQIPRWNENISIIAQAWHFIGGRRNFFL